MDAREFLNRLPPGMRWCLIVVGFVFVNICCLVGVVLGGLEAAHYYELQQDNQPIVKNVASNEATDSEQEEKLTSWEWVLSQRVAYDLSNAEPYGYTYGQRILVGDSNQLPVLYPGASTPINLLCVEMKFNPSLYAQQNGFVHTTSYYVLYQLPDYIWEMNVSSFEYTVKLGCPID